MAPTMFRVSDDEVLLLWRALRAYRSGKKRRAVPATIPRAANAPGITAAPDLTGIGS